ncbi:MAG: phosphotransferase [Chloroflexi bacterium]|nr:phosphotransferase [Chloroflexota bacterium]
MKKQDRTQLWMQADWLETVTAWIQAELRRQGIAQRRPIEQSHIRPWSTVLRVPAQEGDLFFKATDATLAHEPALTLSLSRWYPDTMPELLAADVPRRWLLMRDGGVPLRGIIKEDRDFGHWHSVLRTYAELQIDLCDRLDELLTLGVLDRRLSQLPSLYAQLLDNTEALLIDQQDGLSSADHRRLLALVPRYTEMCEELAAYGLPETLDHGDFHDANIFVRDGHYRFFDWGDSCVAHPFFTILVVLRIVPYVLELEEDHPELARLRDTYLEPWTRFGTRQQLLEAFELAQRIAMVNRALTWHRSVANLEGALKDEYADAVPGWLLEFLQAEDGASA